MSVLGLEVKPSIFFKTLVVGVGIALFSFFAGLWAGGGKCNADEVKPAVIQPQRLHEAIPDQPPGTSVMIATIDGVDKCDVYVPQGADLSRAKRFWNWVKVKKCKVNSYFSHEEKEETPAEEPKAADPPPVAAAKT